MTSLHDRPHRAAARGGRPWLAGRGVAGLADRGRAAQARAGPVGSDGPRCAGHLRAAVGRYRGRPPRRRAATGDRRAGRHGRRHRRPVRGAGQAGGHRRRVRRRRRSADRDAHPPPRVGRRGQPGRRRGHLCPDLQAGQHRIGHRAATAGLRRAGPGRRSAHYGPGGTSHWASRPASPGRCCSSCRAGCCPPGPPSRAPSPTSTTRSPTTCARSAPTAPPRPGARSRPRSTPRTTPCSPRGRRPAAKARSMTHLMAVLNASSRVSEAVDHASPRGHPAAAARRRHPRPARRRERGGGRPRAPARDGLDEDAGTGGPDAGGPHRWPAEPEPAAARSRRRGRPALALSSCGMPWRPSRALSRGRPPRRRARRRGHRCASAPGPCSAPCSTSFGADGSHGPSPSG